MAEQKPRTPASSAPSTPLVGDVQAPSKDLGPAADLTPEEEEAIRNSDARDVSPRAAGPDTSGKRVRYIPYKGGTHTEISKAEFKRALGLDHSAVSANFRNNVFTYEVGDGKNGTLSTEAAEALTKNFPTMYEYLDDGSSSDKDSGEDE